MITEMLASPLMQRALIAAVLVGLAAPVVGTYLVQRGLALMGDGIGHVSLTGVALGWLVGAWLGVSPADALAVPGAIVASLAGALLIELIRQAGHTRGDVALAILFYGGIAGGVILIKFAGGTTTNLNSYLFGSIATVSENDVRTTAVLALLILAVGIGLRGPLFALCHDEEFARTCGLPVGVLNILVAVVSALTVSVSYAGGGRTAGERGDDCARGDCPAGFAFFWAHHESGHGFGCVCLPGWLVYHLCGGGLARRHDRVPTGGHLRVDGCVDVGR